jgi:hypothetical protein
VNDENEIDFRLVEHAPEAMRKAKKNVPADAE